MIYIFEFKWFILEQVPECSSHGQQVGIVSSSSTLHFAKKEVTAEESLVCFEEKKEEEAIVSIVVLEALSKVAEVNHIQVEEPKSKCFFNGCMFHVSCNIFQLLWNSSFKSIMVCSD